VLLLDDTCRPSVSSQEPLGAPVERGDEVIAECKLGEKAHHDEAFRAQTPLDVRLGTPINITYLCANAGEAAHVAGQLPSFELKDSGSPTSSDSEIENNADAQNAAGEARRNAVYP
jgi:hypothetical protein